MDWLLIAFWGDGVTVNIMSRLGFLALSGVVVNDSLIMVHFISEAVKRGESIGDAARAAGVRRFRPILLTSLTTFAGLLPLMFAQSPQSKFMIPMAISLGWGVVFATVITLFLVPVNSLILNDLKRGCRAYWRWQVNGPSKTSESREEVLVETR